MSFHQALEEFWAEGGVAGRGGRYAENCRVLIEGMRALGFRTLLPDRLQAPIIVTFHMPADPSFVFQRFYDRLKDRGYVIYPGKLTVADSFRIGCIGRLYPEHMRGALAAIREVLRRNGGQQRRPGQGGGVRGAHELTIRAGRRRGSPSTAAATACRDEPDRGGLHRRLGAGLYRARDRAGLAPNFARLMRRRRT